MDGELADHRLAGAGGRRDEDAVAVLDLGARAALEVVEGEAHACGEPAELGAGVVPGRPGTGVALRRAQLGLVVRGRGRGMVGHGPTLLAGPDTVVLVRPGVRAAAGAAQI